MKNVGAIEVEAAQAETAPVDQLLVSEWRVLPRLEKGCIGRHRDDGSVSVGRSEPADLLLYGPHWKLVSGWYRLEFRCEAQPPLMACAARSQASKSSFKTRVQQAWRDFTVVGLASGERAIDFEKVPFELGVDAGGEARFEFRLHHLPPMRI